jgi:hypothetical protein
VVVRVGVGFQTFRISCHVALENAMESYFSVETTDISEVTFLLKYLVSEATVQIVI